MVVFTLAAVLFAPVVVSSIVAYLYVLSGWEQNYWYAWRARILSNALSTLMIVPPILFIGRGMFQKQSLTFWRCLEIGLIAAGFRLIGVAALRIETLRGCSVSLSLPLPVAVVGNGPIRRGVGCASLSG